MESDFVDSYLFLHWNGARILCRRFQFGNYFIIYIILRHDFNTYKPFFISKINIKILNQILYWYLPPEYHVSIFYLFSIGSKSWILNYNLPRFFFSLWISSTSILIKKSFCERVCVCVFAPLRATYGTQSSETFFEGASHKVPVRLGRNFRYLY